VNVFCNYDDPFVAPLLNPSDNGHCVFPVERRVAHLANAHKRHFDIVDRPRNFDKVRIIVETAQHWRPEIETVSHGDLCRVALTITPAGMPRG
jgi:hypothetical protein